MLPYFYVFSCFPLKILYKTAVLQVINHANRGAYAGKTGSGSQRNFAAPKASTATRRLYPSRPGRADRAQAASRWSICGSLLSERVLQKNKAPAFCRGVVSVLRKLTRYHIPIFTQRSFEKAQENQGLRQ